MPAIDTIFFDWGGVIADDPGDEFLGQLLKSIGASDAQVEEIFDSYMQDFMCGKISEANFWQALRTAYGLTIHDTISEEFKKWRGLVRNDAIMALSDRARRQGLRVALLTNVFEPTYNVLLQAGYYDPFDAVIASWKVGCAKPQREIYQIALERLHTTAARSLFVDDKQKNLDPAIVMGFKTVLASNPAQIIRDVSAYLPD